MGSSYKDLFKLYDLIRSGEFSSVEKFLLEKPISLNEILPCKGISILHLAVGIEPEEKSKKCAELIIKHGGDPNLSNYEGITPVHIAAIWGRLDNLKLLIGCGGDPYCRDFDGHSAFDYAAKEEQWEVFDYLHHVEDQLDDSSEMPCAYTLDLEKVIVTADQMVAEYETIPDNKTWSSSCRKSEMVRDWCEKTSLTMNKLYPTILTETFTVDTESQPWRSINITKNMTLDLTYDLSQSNCNETNNSFKTCLSKGVSPGPVEISGIQRLHITANETNTQANFNPEKQRLSTYENFLLPYTPDSITYRKKQNQSKDAEQRLTFDSSQSLLTSDNSVLDKALMVAQNKTNERLSMSQETDCQTDVKACNTRRSSASSGVSSNYSSGSIVIATVQEEYKYEDKEEDVVLIEKRLLVSPVVLPVEEPIDNSPDSTIISVASSLPPSMEYDNTTLRAELIRHGFTPGPIQDSTRTLYLKKLKTLMKNNPLPDKSKKQELNEEKRKCPPKVQKSYSIELEKSMRTDDWMNKLTIYAELEEKARTDFANPNKKWREGTTKTSFTYLLLDPRLSANLPARASKQSLHVSWVTFVDSIFYVGKGKRSRPYSHLYQALNLWKRDFKATKDKKVQHILDIWTDKVGVICLHIFQNVIPAEAFTYEASMIDVLGIQNLTNIKSGQYYGSVASWPMKEKRMLGLYMLYKAMLIFLSEGERQLRPDDID